MEVGRQLLQVMREQRGVLGEPPGRSGIGYQEVHVAAQRRRRGARTAFPARAGLRCRRGMRATAGGDPECHGGGRGDGPLHVSCHFPAPLLVPGWRAEPLEAAQEAPGRCVRTCARELAWSPHTRVQHRGTGELVLDCDWFSLQDAQSFARAARCVNRQLKARFHDSETYSWYRLRSFRPRSFLDDHAG